MAEIENKAGNDPSSYINEIRQRAYGDNYNPAVHEHTNQGFAANELAILYERDMEFVWEGKRWFDGYPQNCFLYEYYELYLQVLILISKMKMKGKIVFIISLVACILCINACKTAEKSASKSALANVSDVAAGKNDAALVEKYWKLIELYGHPVAVQDDKAKEAHIIFKNEGSRFNGSAGCNRITGAYRTGESGAIVFSQTAATRMMCLNIETETQFLKVLETADNYTVQNDTLVLNNAEMKPLARFVTVYLR
jgi:heat shock protein HslJ